MAEIMVTTDGKEGLFGLPDGAPCPRVGEILRYEFAVWDEEKSQWADDSWRHHKALHGKAWKVTRVEHHIRRNSIQSTKCYTWVRVRRLERSSKP